MSDRPLETATATVPPRRARDPWLHFACPHCGKRNKIDAVAAGRSAACARCKQRVTVTAAVGSPSTPSTPPASPVMKAIDPKPAAPSPLRQLSAHVAARDEATKAIAAAPRPLLRLPTWAMVTLHVGVTLGSIAAIWALHAYGYLPGFDAATTHTTVVVVPAAAR